MDLDQVHALVTDPRRTGTAAEWADYLEELRARYADIAMAMNRLAADRSWSQRPDEWVEDQLVLGAVVVHQIGELSGEYVQALAWGERLLELGRAGSPALRAELMLRVSELHRVTGDAQRCVVLVNQAAELLGLLELSEEQIDELAPISCHALFCLGSAAIIEARPDEARRLLAHARSHAGDSDAHMWSFLLLAAVEDEAGRHEEALPLVETAVEMAERLGDRRMLQAARNNRACTLRLLGRYAEAYDAFEEALPEILEDGVPDTVLTSAEDFACLLLDMGRDRDGALVMGAVDAGRESLAIPRVELQEAQLAPSVEAARRRLGEEWEELHELGAKHDVPGALAEVLIRP